MLQTSIEKHHPCFSNQRKNLWERIHLPVADRCNVKCVFCEQKFGCCGTKYPGSAARVMTQFEAIKRLELELEKRENLNIIAVSGPGDPLASDNAIKTLQKVSELHPRGHICLSTNGILIKEKLPILSEINVSTISVSVHAATPQTASRTYEWIDRNEPTPLDIELAEYILNRQLAGIRGATKLGIVVKVNTVYLPSINDHEIVEIARRVSQRGASLQNIMPLVPAGRLHSTIPPTHEAVQDIQNRASRYIRQFHYCYHCRSDVVGIPGHDCIL